MLFLMLMFFELRNKTDYDNRVVVPKWQNKAKENVLTTETHQPNITEYDRA